MRFTGISDWSFQSEIRNPKSEIRNLLCLSAYLQKYELSVSALDLFSGLPKGSRRIYLVVGYLELFFDGHLRSHASASLFNAQAVAADESSQLQCRVAVNDDQLIVQLVKARLDHESRVYDNDSSCRDLIQFDDAPKNFCAHFRVDEGVQQSSLSSVVKNNLAKFPAINRAVFKDYVAAKSFPDFFICRLTRRQKVVRDKIGIDNVGPELCKHPGRAAFAGSDVSSQTHVQHPAMIAQHKPPLTADSPMR